MNKPPEMGGTGTIQDGNCLIAMGIPHGYNIIGTCGSCGGPLISPQMWAGTGPRTIHCQDCGKMPKSIIAPNWGPIMEMQ